MISPQEVAVIVLAAGRSARFGRPKLLEHLHGQPLVSHTVRLAECSPFGSKIAVFPSEVTPLKCVLDAAGFETVINDNSDAGMSCSLQLGIAASGNAAAVMVLLADMPFVTQSHLERLLRAYDPAVGCVASSLGGVGQPPALIGRMHFDALADLDGDQGARNLIRSGLLIDVDSHLLTDIDEPQTLDRLNRAWRDGRRGPERVEP